MEDKKEVKKNMDFTAKVTTKKQKKSLEEKVKEDSNDIGQTVLTDKDGNTSVVVGKGFTGDATNNHKIVNNVLTEDDNLVDDDKEFEEFEIDKKFKKKTIEQWLEFHNSKIKNSNKIKVGNKVDACFNYVVNTSGGILMIPDLRALDVDPKSQEMLNFQPGEWVDLETMFEPIVINRNRMKGLMNAFKMKSNLDSRLPALLCIEDPDELPYFPIELVRKSLVQRMIDKGIPRLQTGVTEFDKALEKDVEKEKTRNEKIMKQAIDNYSTKGKKTQEQIANEV